MLKGKWRALWIVLLVPFLVLSLAAILSFLLFGFHFVRYVIQPMPVPTVIGSRSITSTTLPLRELWRRNDVLLRYHGLGPPLLSTAEGTLFFVNHSQGWLEARLQVLDAATGRLRWQTDDIANTPEHSLAASPGHVFVAVDWNIQAYDLSDGRLLWRTPGRLPELTRYDLYPKADEVIVYSTEDSRSKSRDVLSVYDAQTGELLQQDRIEATDARLLWRTPSVDYRDDCKQFSATDRGSGKTMWQITIKDCVRFWPDSIDSAKVFSTRAGELVTVDVGTGEVKWHYPQKCFSNAVVMGGIVYATCEDGALIGINRETGAEVGMIKFSPVGAADVPTYWLATDGGRIFAYFGDTQELIAFGP